MVQMQCQEPRHLNMSLFYREVYELIAHFLDLFGKTSIGVDNIIHIDKFKLKFHKIWKM